jgi:hypothetical protein
MDGAMFLVSSTDLSRYTVFRICMAKRTPRRPRRPYTAATCLKLVVLRVLRYVLADE